MDEIFQRARTLHLAGELEEAEALYRTILDYRPAWTLGNLGMIMRITGRLEEAERYLREALVVDPVAAGLHHSLGMTLLQLHRYAEGWPRYEARHRMYSRPTRDDLPEWGGESLKGKRILVLGEQGLGDQILFSRFLPLLTQQASEVMLAVNRPLGELLRQLPIRMVWGRAFEQEPADVWASIGSVPRWLEAGPSDAPAPYLRAPAPQADEARYGIMLAGSPGNPNPERIPPPGVHRAIRGLAPFVDLDPEVSGAASFAATADRIAGLRGVVSVDTSVAHLAGALGRRCLVLAPRPAHDWYLDWDGDGSPWYPSLRVVRQAEPGNWAGLLARLAGALT